MKNDEHLSPETVAAYRKGLLTADQRQSAGKHLIFCEECGKLAPPPTKEEILRAILGERWKPGLKK